MGSLDSLSVKIHKEIVSIEVQVQHIPLVLKVPIQKILKKDI